ncbi:MAG: peptidylprolyl isomerase [Rhodospirillaceae bacterium]|nr:peptidylprolyl isomerase [Rhodospirillaceae bacterium]
MTFRRHALATVTTLILCFAGSARAQTSDTVVAELNGTPITFNEIAAFQQTIPNAAEMETASILPRLIEFYIDQQLMGSAARGRGLENDPDVQLQLQRLEDELVRQAYLRDEISDRVTEDRIREAYDKKMETYVQDEEVKARHILVETEDEANAILRELSDGATFEDLARDRSTGPSGPQGGDLGYFTRGTMVPEFSESAFALSAGEITSSPVKTDFGWHLIKVEEKRLKPAPTFEEMRVEVRNELSDAAVQAVLTELRGRAEIRITPTAAE